MQLTIALQPTPLEMGTVQVEAEPVSAYSNVESGYGIFAGYSWQTFELVLE